MLAYWTPPFTAMKKDPRMPCVLPRTRRRPLLLLLMAVACASDEPATPHRLEAQAIKQPAQPAQAVPAASVRQPTPVARKDVPRTPAWRQALNDTLHAPALPAVTVLATAVLALLAFLAITVRTLVRWRRTVGSGMEAVVPMHLEQRLGRVTKEQLDALAALRDATDRRFTAVLTSMEEEQQQQVQLLRQLRGELDRRDAEIRSLRSQLEGAEKDAHARRLVKLANFANNLRRQVLASQLQPNDALSFLHDEIRDGLAEHAVEEVVPAVGAAVAAQPDGLHEIVRQEIDTHAGGTGSAALIAAVLAPAYIRRTTVGETIVLQKARITVTQENPA